MRSFFPSLSYLQILPYRLFFKTKPLTYIKHKQEKKKNNFQKVVAGFSPLLVSSGT